jgi:AraC-like DNA-binding protein
MHVFTEQFRYVIAVLTARRGEATHFRPRGVAPSVIVGAFRTSQSARYTRDFHRQSSSRHAERLFDRVCSVVKDGFPDPDLTPFAVAAAAGISLRYLQKLCTPRDTPCGQFIHSMRLDHAARLLQRRAVCSTKRPLSDIAFEAGFRDYKFSQEKSASASAVVRGSMHKATDAWA